MIEQFPGLTPAAVNRLFIQAGEVAGFPNMFGDTPDAAPALTAAQTLERMRARYVVDGDTLRQR